VAGCGSSSTSSSGGGGNFIAEANGACRTAYAKVKALRPAGKGGETTADIAATAPKVAVIAQAMLGQLTSLTPPSSVQAEYTKMLAAWRQEIASDLVRRQAALAHDATRLGEADLQIETLAKEFDSAASKVGLTVCAANP
jgi:hypothetical protein